MDATGFTLFLLTFVAIAVVVLVIAVAGCLYCIVDLHRELSVIVDLHRRVTLQSQVKNPLDLQPKAAPPTPDQPQTVVRSDVDLIGTESLQAHLSAIGEKYDLASFTLASEDGLVIGSTRPDPQEEAAEYSYLYLQGKTPDEKEVALIGVPHKGETVIGIVRSMRQLPGDALELLKNDTGDALQRWV